MSRTSPRRPSRTNTVAVRARALTAEDMTKFTNPTGGKNIDTLWAALRSAGVAHGAADGASKLWDTLTAELIDLPRDVRWAACSQAGRAWLVEYAVKQNVRVDRQVLEGLWAEWGRVTGVPCPQ